MITRICNIEDLYPGMVVRWEWRRNHCLAEEYGLSPSIRPLGQVAQIRDVKDCRIRLYDAADVEIPAASLLSCDYCLLSSPLFHPSIRSGSASSDLTRRLSNGCRMTPDETAVFRRTPDAPAVMHEAAQRIDLLESLLWDAAVVMKADTEMRWDSLSCEERKERINSLMVLASTLRADPDILLPNVAREEKPQAVGLLTALWSLIQT